MANEHYQPGTDHTIGPCPSRVSTALVSTQSAASNAWAVTDRIACRNARWACFWIKSSIDSGASAAVPQIRIMASAEENPAIGDDSWYPLCVTDAAPTPTVLTGTVASGEDMTMQPEWGVHVVYPAAFTLGALSDADTDELRFMLEVRCAAAHWLYVAYHELGDSTDPTVLEIKFNLGM